MKIHKNLVYLFKLYINKISMKNWNSYSPKEKAKLMQIFIRNGITDLNQMQEYINSFDVNTKKNLNSLDSDVQALNKPTPTTYNTGGKKQSVEMTPSEAEALNRKLDTSQYMLAVGSSPEDPVYLSPGYLEPATVKAFDSQEDYNRHIGDKFGEYVSNSISNAGTKLAPVLAGAAAFPFALNLGMAAYANPFVRSTLDIIGAIDGARNFSSDNGVRKTIRLAKEGDTWGAVKSGVGDLKAIVRAHYGINSPKASKNKYGGKLNTFETGGDKDSSYIQNVFLDPLSLATLNKINETKLGVPYRDFNSSDYSYYDANKNNMPIEEGGHWTSRNSETGQILKSSDHPTVIKELTEGLKKGYVPYENPIDGLFYSIPKPISYPDIPMRSLNERYNIFEDEKANIPKKAHKESLDKFIKNNPTLYGLNTADFADFFSQLAGLEGSYNKDAGKGMIYSGYYGLKDGSDDTEDEQHKRAFKHLAGLFQNSIVKEDILKGLSLGYSPAQILAKYWNQGNRVTQFLWNGVDDKDGKGSKISEYGWNMTADIDYLKYLKDAITDDEVKVKDAKSLNEAIVRVRKPGINYSNREADILKFNRDRNDGFDTKKLKVGDTIYLTPLQKNK